MRSTAASTPDRGRLRRADRQASFGAGNPSRRARGRLKFAPGTPRGHVSSAATVAPRSSRHTRSVEAIAAHHRIGVGVHYTAAADAGAVPNATGSSTISLSIPLALAVDPTGNSVPQTATDTARITDPPPPVHTRFLPWRRRSSIPVALGTSARPPSAAQTRPVGRGVGASALAAACHAPTGYSRVLKYQLINTSRVLLWNNSTDILVL